MAARRAARPRCIKPQLSAEQEPATRGVGGRDVLGTLGQGAIFDFRHSHRYAGRWIMEIISLTVESMVDGAALDPKHHPHDKTRDVSLCCSLIIQT